LNEIKYFTRLCPQEHHQLAIPGGIEHRTRFWMGYRFSNGKPELSLPPGIKVPAAAVQGLTRHNVKEFKNLGVLLPGIYKEFGGRMEV